MGSSNIVYSYGDNMNKIEKWRKKMLENPPPEIGKIEDLPEDIKKKLGFI
jgi:uncharacterized Rossmann fold enzyme